MQQQINLYLYLPRPVKSLLTLRVMAICYAAFVALIFIMQLEGLWHTHSLRKELAKTEVELTNAQQSLDATRVRYPSIDPQDLGMNVQTLEQGLQAKSKVFTLLSHTVRFSAYMRGLANAITNGTWLTTINFSSNEDGISLKGLSTQASNLEVFLGQLRNQEVFAGMSFELDELTESNNPNTNDTQATPTKLVNFLITTKVANTL